MAINGLLTDIGLTNSQIALNNQGWFIFPTRFEVADTAGVFSKTRVGARTWAGSTAYSVGDLVVPTTLNGFYFIVSVAGTSGGSEPSWPTSPGSVTDGGVTWDFVGATTGGLEVIWFAASISTRIEAPPNTLEIVLTIPPGADPGDRDIEEIYIFAEDQLGVEFLLGIGQPSATITYANEGTTSLRLAITLTNVNISGLFIFKYTQATEISEHSVDPNAHPDIRDILQLQFNLAANGDMGVDQNVGGFDMSGKTFGFGPADWEGQLTAGGAVSGTLIRKITSAIQGGRSMHFSGISLTGGGEELHVRKKIRGDTARLLSNNPWSVSTDYVVGDIVVPTASPLLRFRAIIAGTSDSVEPTWPGLAGDTIADGGVTWEAILGNFSMSWEAFQDTLATQFAIITLSTPDALDDFEGSSTTLLTSGATDHPMLDGVVTTVERAAIVLPNVDNGLLIDIQVDTGGLTTKNFEFSRFKFEPTEKTSPYLSPPHIWEQIAASPYLEDLLDFQIIIGSQVQVDANRATNTINDFAADVVDGDRILILGGTHTLTAPVLITEDDVYIISLSLRAIIAFGAHTFTASGARNVINIRTSGAGAGDVIVSGDGTILTALDTALTAIAHSGGAMALTTGSSGGIKRGSTTTPGHNQELVDRQYLDSLYASQSLLMSIAINDPAAIVVAASQFVGRKATGDVGAMSVAEALVVLGVEAGATADQTAGEIKTAYESNANTNEFDDDEQTKLAGIETLATADQTKADIDALGIDAETVDGRNPGSVNGLATLDGSGDVPDAQIPSSIARDIELHNEDHATRHERAGADEINGDHLDIDWNPSNYTPTTAPAEAANVDDLTAHLAGIDSKLGSETQLGVFTITTGGPTYTYGTNSEGLLLVNETEDVTVTLLDAAGNTGKILQIKNIMAANSVTIDGLAGDTIDGALTLVLGAQYQSVTLVSNGINWFII